MKFLGLRKKLNECITSDILQCYKTGSMELKIGELLKVDPLKWLHQRLQELVYFLRNWCDVDVNASSDTKLNIVCKIVELIYYCHSSRIVIPQYFLESLIFELFGHQEALIHTCNSG